MKALKADLKRWNREEFGDLAFRKNLLTELMGLDAREELVYEKNSEKRVKQNVKLLKGKRLESDASSWNNDSVF